MFSNTGVCAVGALWLATGRTEQEAQGRWGDNDAEAWDPAFEDDTDIYSWDDKVLHPVLVKYLDGLEDTRSVWRWNDNSVAVKDPNSIYGGNDRGLSRERLKQYLRGLPEVDVEL